MAYFFQILKSSYLIVKTSFGTRKKTFTFRIIFMHNKVNLYYRSKSKVRRNVKKVKKRKYRSRGKVNISHYCQLLFEFKSEKTTSYFRKNNNFIPYLFYFW